MDVFRHSDSIRVLPKDLWHHEDVRDHRRLGCISVIVALEYWHRRMLTAMMHQRLNASRQVLVVATSTTALPLFEDTLFFHTPLSLETNIHHLSEAWSAINEYRRI